ncbi:MAG: hypothetical protein K9J49_11970, partial [Candidatus Methylopumilus sp.]|nr:hypothetical protein [Candidatus Methylopumilus sp.]
GGQRDGYGDFFDCKPVECKLFALKQQHPPLRSTRLVGRNDFLRDEISSGCQNKKIEIEKSDRMCMGNQYCILITQVHCRNPPKDGFDIFL